MLPFSRMISLLNWQHGQVPAPEAHGPFELVMWENACYLLPETRRREVFEALRDQVGMNPAAIFGANDSTLLPLAQRGGMRPEVRVFRWREIARITLEQFGGDLDLILRMTPADAKRALKQFPNIGDPGAEKILLFCGMRCGLPLESNGLRVLVRVGWARAQANYGRMYRDVQGNIAGVVPGEIEALRAAFLLLREHGRATCKEKAPHCEECLLAHGCDYAQRTSAGYLAAGR